jgi:hypothetical protein
VLRECFAEIIAVAGAPTITLTVSNTAPYFRVSAAGTSGSCSVDLPRGSDAVFAHSVNSKGMAGADDDTHASAPAPGVDESVSSGLLMPLVEQAMRPLHCSTKAFMRINDEVSGAARCARPPA